MKRVLVKIRRCRLNVALAAGLGATLLLAGFTAAAVTANKPVTVSVENLELTFDGGFAPSVVAGTGRTPAAFVFEGRIQTVDGTHPPALQEVVLEADKNAAIDVTGMPACHLGIQADTPQSLEELCKGAVIGKGIANIEFAFPESKPVVFGPKILLVNGGSKRGVITLYVDIRTEFPVPGNLIAPIKIRKIDSGRFGMQAVVSIPKIAGGSGSITQFAVMIDKKFTYRGKKASVVTVKCPDGKLITHAEAVFVDGTRAGAQFRRSCSQK